MIVGLLYILPVPRHWLRQLIPVTALSKGCHYPKRSAHRKDLQLNCVRETAVRSSYFFRGRGLGISSSSDLFDSRADQSYGLRFAQRYIAHSAKLIVQALVL